MHKVNFICIYIPTIKKFGVSLFSEGHLHREFMDEPRYLDFCKNLDKNMEISGLIVDIDQEVKDYFYKVRDSYLAAKEKGNV